MNELDNRGSHYYLAKYWAESLAEQNADADLKAKFSPVAQKLAENEDKIVGELNDAQGSPMNIGGYYQPNEDLADKAMRPSQTLNKILEEI